MFQCILGVFSKANPDDVSDRFNAYMNGVSSNYPNAISYQNLGTRSQKGNYYYVAADADKLSDAFANIWTQVSSEANSPLSQTSTSGAEAKQVVFTDQLGDYMTVHNFTSVVAYGHRFDNPKKTTDSKTNTDTYTFSGTVSGNPVYEHDVNLNTMDITVQHHDNGQGDTVAVRIPDTLLPMRLYTAFVDKDGKVTTGLEPANPIRVFYSVGLQDGVQDALASPDVAMKQYIASHSDQQGNVYFYESTYGDGESGAQASFTPAASNDFYYFAKDTKLYTAQDTNHPATKFDPSATYYYPRTVYADNQKKTIWITANASSHLDGHVECGSGSCVVKAGTPRFDLMEHYAVAKKSDNGNPTNTASYVSTPSWDGQRIVVSLGNNGRMVKPLPGMLSIANAVDWGNGTKNADKRFTYQVHFANSREAVTDDYLYTLYNADGSSSTDTLHVVNGVGTLSMKDGQHVTIVGATPGTSYHVEAVNPGEGWTVDPTGGVSGVLSANERKQVTFASTYHAAAATLQDGAIAGTKTVVGRAWAKDESFTFDLRKAGKAAETKSEAAPEADANLVQSVTVSNEGDGHQSGDKVTFKFKAMEYTQPGDYYYFVSERHPDVAKAGMHYSDAAYFVHVTVTDTGAGQLKVSNTKMWLAKTDDGEQVIFRDESLSDSTAVFSADFTNTYDDAQHNTRTVTVKGVKQYIDETGSNPNNRIGKFQVRIAPSASNDSASDPLRSVKNFADGSAVVDVDTAGAWSQSLTYGTANIGKNYDYTVSEVVPSGVSAEHATLNGMTYDTRTYTVHVQVGHDDDGLTNPVVTVNDAKGQPVSEGMTFANTYKAAPTGAVSLDDQLRPQVQVSGHDAAEGKFELGMKLMSKNDKSVQLAKGDSFTAWEDQAVTTGALKDGETGEVTFPGVRFTKPGTYTFQIWQTTESGSGWNVDGHKYLVTYTVTDENGTLVAKASTSGDRLFANAYSAADVAYEGIVMSVKLSGRALQANNFTYTITPITEGAPSVPQDDATFSNPYGGADGQYVTWPAGEAGAVHRYPLEGLTFTKANAGKTYEYLVSEVNDGVGGYTYDDQPVTVAIHVYDNGDGTLHTTTSVTKHGQTTDYQHGDKAVASFANTYQVAPKSATVDFHKVIDGRQWQDGDSFTFDIKPQVDGSTVDEAALKAAITGGSSKTVATSDTVASAGKYAPFSFDFTFSKPGTYVYSVSEQGAGEVSKGVAKSSETATITYTVSDQGDGTMKASAKVSGLTQQDGAYTFHNTYSIAQQAYQGVHVSQTLTGRDIKDSEFGFTVTGTKSDMQRAGFDKNSVTKHFGAASQQNGTATSAVESLLSGITMTQQDVENNTVLSYTLDPVLPADDDAQTAGTQSQGVTYDTASHTVLVWATDNLDGTLTIHTKVDGKEVQGVPSVTFANTYHANAASLSGKTSVGGTLTLNGRDMWNGESMTFTLTPQDDATTQAVADGVVSMASSKRRAAAAALGTVKVTDATEGKRQAFSFGTMRITAAGTYTFAINQTAHNDKAIADIADGADGMTYDRHAGTVTITVTDNGMGKLQAEVRYGGKGDKTSADFVDAYAVTHDATYGDDADVLLGGHKRMADSSGSYTLKQGDFSFMWRANDASAPLPQGEGVEDGQDNGGKPVKIVKNGAPVDGVATYDFGTITFGHKDMSGAKTVADQPGVLEKTFSYEVFEDTWHDMAAGVSPDNARYVVTFTVQENQQHGTITVTDVNAVRVVDSNGIDTKASAQDAVKMGALDFTNKYSTEFVTGFQNIRETLNGRNFTKDESMSFHVAVEGVDAEGKALSKDEMPTIDNSNNNASSSVESQEGNTVVYDLTVTPSATGGDANIANFTTGTITYRHAGTYTFTITQHEPKSMAKVSHDTTTYKVVVKITKNGSSNALKREVSVFKNGEAFTPNGTLNFENDYRPDDVTLSSVNAVKAKVAMQGRVWKSSDTVTLQLKAQGSAPMPNKAGEHETLSEDGKTLTATLPATEGGSEALKHTFSAMQFTKDDMGGAMSKTYSYTIEQTGKSGNGVTIDSHVATVKVTVTDDGKGALTASTAVDNRTAADEHDAKATDTAAFTNVYKASSVSVNGDNAPKITSQLTGRDVALQAAEFSYTATIAPYDDTANLDGVRTTELHGVNQATGAVVFDGAFDFTKPGTYQVSVTQDKPAQASRFITYDEHAFTYMVTVSDPLDGKLRVQVSDESTDNGGSTFTNTYQTPQNVEQITKTFVGEDDKETSTIDVNRHMVGVGDKLTYTVTWVNTAMDAAGESIPADVDVLVGLPDGLSIVDGSITHGGQSRENEAGSYSRVVSWTLPNCAAEASGTVSFQVEVAEGAATATALKSQALVDVEGESYAGASDLEVTDPVYVNVPSVSAAVASPKGVSRAEGEAHVGDIVTYTVKFRNSSTGRSDAVVEDTLPQGLTYIDASDDGTYNAQERTVRWSVRSISPETTSSVTFRAKVNEDATGGSIDNVARATMNVARDQAANDTNESPRDIDPQLKSNVVSTRVGAGSVTVGTTIETDPQDGTAVDTAKRFTITVGLHDAAGEALTGAYAYTGTVDGQQQISGTVSNGNTITLGHQGSVTITGLPTGTAYTFEEAAEAGYTVDNGTRRDGEVTDGSTANLQFVNHYSAQTGDKVPTNFVLTSLLKGTAWKPNAFAFTYTLTAKSGETAAGEAIDAKDMPMPQSATTTVTEPTEGDGQTALFDFGGMEYHRVGTYVYEVNQAKGDNMGVAYDTHTATVTVNVVDNHDGTMSATAKVEDGTFTNQYSAGTVNYDQTVGMRIVNTLTGRAIDEGQYQFAVKPTNEDAKTLLGADGQVLTAGAASLGGADGNTSTSTLPITLSHSFALADAGKTYTFTVRQSKAPTATGYANSGHVYTVSIAVSHDGKGTLQVATTVDGEVVSNVTASKSSPLSDQPIDLTFANTYTASSASLGDDTSAPFAVSKTLIGRAMQAGEFQFTLRNAKGETVQTASNAAAADGQPGAVTFQPMTYSLQQLNADVANGIATRRAQGSQVVYEYQYTIAEDTAALPAGVTALVGAGALTVSVTDDGNGTLSAAVSYPQGADAVSLVNEYGADASATQTMNIVGLEQLHVQSGDNPPAIQGRYTYTIAGSQGAPMPAQTTAISDESGTVNFGDITYTMHNVFGESATRTKKNVGSEAREKTFTYTVSATGQVTGVTMQPSEQTVQVSVRDNGDGTITVSKVASSNAAQNGMDFVFDPTYAVQPVSSSVTASVPVKTMIDGRDLREDEFNFRMVDETSADTVWTAANNADGSADFPAIEFTQTGEYRYLIGELNDHHTGVVYDARTYEAVATVTDNGDGTLQVSWRVFLVDNAEQGEANVHANVEVDTMTFANFYEPLATSVQVSGAVRLSGKALQSGEFSFVLQGDQGAPMPIGAQGDTSKVTNDSKGVIMFEPIMLTSVGTYRYVLTQEIGNVEGMTYDDLAYVITVTVADVGQQGRLSATVSYGDGITGAVFTNTYVPKHDEPSEQHSVGNGEARKEDDEAGATTVADTGSAIVPVLLCGLLAAAAGATGKRYGRRR